MHTLMASTSPIHFRDVPRCENVVTSAEKPFPNVAFIFVCALTRRGFFYACPGKDAEFTVRVLENIFAELRQLGYNISKIVRWDSRANVAHPYAALYVPLVTSPFFDSHHL